MRKIQVDGATVYQLNKNGVNLWSCNVQPGFTTAGNRFPDTECENIAVKMSAVNDLVDALEKLLTVTEHLKPCPGVVAEAIKALNKSKGII